MNDTIRRDKSALRDAIRKKVDDILDRPPITNGTVEIILTYNCGGLRDANVKKHDSERIEV